MQQVRFVVLTLVGLCGGAGAWADVVNVDIEAGAAGDTTHVGDDGPLSTPTGTLWNSVQAGATDLQTEFGNFSPFDIVYPGAPGPFAYNDPNINNLQDSGNFGAFMILDLVPGAVYQLAVYCGTNGGFIFGDKNGTRPFFFTHPEADGWSLPGTQGDGGDYFLVDNVQPAEISPGVWGVGINPDGAITGLQISGTVPEPAGLALLAVGGLLLRRKR